MYRAIESDSALVRDYMNAHKRFGPDIYDRINRREVRRNSPLGKEFEAFHASLAEKIERIRRQHTDTTASDQRDLLFGAQLARNIAVLPRYCGERWPFAAVSLRDSLMAENLMHLIDRQYPGEKVVIWAHNIHIGRSWSDAKLSDIHTQEFAWATNRLDRATRMMGEYLDERYGDAEYAIGLYMASGSYETIKGEKLRVRPPRRDSVEYLLRDPQTAAVYLDLTRTTDGSGYDWKRASSRGQVGSNWYSIVPGDQFDGLIVVSRATIPLQ